MTRTYRTVAREVESARADLAAVRDGAPRLPGNRPFTVVRQSKPFAAAFARLAALEERRARARRALPSELTWLEQGERVAAWPRKPRTRKARKPATARTFGRTVSPRARRAARLRELRTIAGTIRMAEVD